MINLKNNGVILSKVVTRKRFTLGNSRALSAREVVTMDNGEVWSVAYRRPEHFNHRGGIPLTVAFKMGHCATFGDAVELIKVMEAQFITEEFPTAGVK